MKKLLIYAYLLGITNLYGQEMPKSSSIDRFADYQLFKGNRQFASVSFSGGWGGLQGFVGGINAKQMFSLPNGRMFLGFQGEYNGSGKFYNRFSAGLVGRYYIFNTNRWSAFAQSSLNVGRSNFSNAYYVQNFSSPSSGINSTYMRATNNFITMDAGVGLQYRVTKRLAFEVLATRPIFFKQKTIFQTPDTWMGNYRPPLTPQFKFGINYFFGR